MFSIYCITNLKTNKKYIGYTNNVKKRWCDHKRHGTKENNKNHIPLYESMKKHGIEFFTFEILEEVETSEEAQNKEKEYIHFYNTYKHGYNATLGGDGGDTSNSSKFKEWVIYVKENGIYKGSNNYWYGIGAMTGKKHSQEARQKQSEARQKYWDSLNSSARIERCKTKGNKNGMFGKIPKNSLSIIFDNKKYDSLAAASRVTGHSALFIKKHGVLCQ